jgi:hypothetical protein
LAMEKRKFLLFGSSCDTTYLRLLTCVASRQRWQQSYTHTDKQHTHTHTRSCCCTKAVIVIWKENETSFSSRISQCIEENQKKKKTDVMVLDFGGCRYRRRRRGGGQRLRIIDGTYIHHTRRNGYRWSAVWCVRPGIFPFFFFSFYFPPSSNRCVLIWCAAHFSTNNWNRWLSRLLNNWPFRIDRYPQIYTFPTHTWEFRRIDKSTSSQSQR